MPRVLSDADIESFRRDGYIFPLPVTSAAEATAFRTRLAAVEAHDGGRLSRSTNQKPHLLLPWLNELIRHPRVLDAVEDILGHDLF
jgi:non-haem Fe2+, alpha-ketoglutarate-dependent halogenase